MDTYILHRQKMEQLPGANPVTVKEFELGGKKLKFRKMKLSDVTLMNDIQSRQLDDPSGALDKDGKIKKISLRPEVITMKCLAFLLVTDEDKTIEEKEDYIMNLEVNGLDDFFELDRIFLELGAKKKTEEVTTNNTKRPAKKPKKKQAKK